MDVQAALDYLYALKFFGELRTDRIQKVLAALGDPQDSFTSVHVAGTNGKGSVTTMVHAALRAAGKRAARYTSPHLTRFNERIVVDEEQIGDEELIALVAEIRAKIEPEGLQPSFFEFTTALAFLHFARKNVKFAVVETGLGGRLDATNVLNPAVTVITTISKDHTAILGEELEQIAAEKAGIIKPHTPLVLGERNQALRNVFAGRCRELDAPLVDVEPTDYVPSLPGAHQRRNAATAATAAKTLGLDEAAIKQGIESAFIPGRLEWIDDVLLDCAHNEEGIAALANYLKSIDKKFTIIFGVRDGKDAKELLAPLQPYAERILLSEASFKAKPRAELEAELGAEVKPLREALAAAKAHAEPVLVTGSLYLVGDARGILKGIAPCIVKVQY